MKFNILLKLQNFHPFVNSWFDKLTMTRRNSRTINCHPEPVEGQYCHYSTSIFLIILLVASTLFFCKKKPIEQPKNMRPVISEEGLKIKFDPESPGLGQIKVSKFSYLLMSNQYSSQKHSHCCCPTFVLWNFGLMFELCQLKLNWHSNFSQLNKS